MTTYSTSIPKLTTDFKLQAALGKIEGVTSFDKFGRNPDIDTTTDPEDIWNGSGVYTGQPTGSAETMEIFSSVAADTNTTGTGAWTVKVTDLLDGSGNEMPDITVNLAGTTPVSLGAQTYNRTARIEVLTAGTGGSNVGTLTLRHTTTTANIFAVMPIGVNKTAIMAHTVPLGKTLLIDRATIAMTRASGAAGSAHVSLIRRPLGGVYNTLRSPEISNSMSYEFVDNGYIVFNERDDIIFRVNSVSDNNTQAIAEMDGYLFDNAIWDL